MSDTAVIELTARRVADRWPSMTGVEMAERPPDIDWICPGLGLAPGLAIFGGAGYSGKTLLIQALLLSVVSGQPFLGRFECKMLPSLHLNWEMNREAAWRRYYAMGRSRGIDLRKIGKRLDMRTRPACYLDDKDGLSLKDLEWMLDVMRPGVCFIDSYRAAHKDVDENDSRARIGLDVLARLGEKYGCVMIVIVHTRKPKDDDDDDERFTIRGSGSFFDSADCVWMIRQADGVVRMKNYKTRDRGAQQNIIGLKFVGESNDDGELLSVEYVDIDGVSARNDTVDAGIERMATLGRRILAVLERAPKGFPAGAISMMIPSAKSRDITTLLKLMVAKGTVLEEGIGADRFYLKAR